MECVFLLAGVVCNPPAACNYQLFLKAPLYRQPLRLPGVLKSLPAKVGMDLSWQRVGTDWGVLAGECRAVQSKS